MIKNQIRDKPIAATLVARPRDALNLMKTADDVIIVFRFFCCPSLLQRCPAISMTTVAGLPICGIYCLFSSLGILRYGTH